MAYSWVNKFNGIERDGPFATIKAAKRNAVDVFVHIQSGFAFDLAIEDGSNNIVARGHIKRGKWIDGAYTPDNKPGDDPEERGECLPE